MTTAEAFRAEEARHLQEAADSFERCDTDGFLSQWAHGMLAELAGAKASLAEAGGMAKFPALFRRSDGARVRARVITYRCRFAHANRSAWSIVGADGSPDRRFPLIPLNALNSKRSKLWKMGLEQRYEWAKAEAFMDGRGTGLSGTCWVAYKRLDGGFPSDAVPFEGGLDG